MYKRQAYTTAAISEVREAMERNLRKKGYEAKATSFTVQTPLKIKTTEGLYINIHEAALVDYSAMLLNVDDKEFNFSACLLYTATSWDNAWVTEHPDWYTQDANGNVVQPQEQPWADVADLNFDNETMQQAMIDAMKYWVTEIGIDGYRCDYAEGVPDAFWKKAIAELRTLDNNLLMLAEGGKTSLMNNGFNLLYGWNFHSKLKDYYAGKCSLTDLYAMNTSELEGMPKGDVYKRQHVHCS